MFRGVSFNMSATCFRPTHSALTQQTYCRSTRVTSQYTMTPNKKRGNKKVKLAFAVNKKSGSCYTAVLTLRF